MEKKQGCKRRVIFLGFVAFSCSVAAEFEKAKAEDMKLDGSLCSLPRAPTFGLGVAAMVCQSVAQIMRTSAVGSRCALWVAGTQSWPSSSLSSHVNRMSNRGRIRRGRRGRGRGRVDGRGTETVHPEARVGSGASVEREPGVTQTEFRELVGIMVQIAQALTHQPQGAPLV